MSECNHDCSSCSSNCADREPGSFLEKPHPDSSVKKVIGVVSGKGGVGKSMVTDLLAVAFSRKGYHCGILDADITGPSIPKAFGITEKAMGNATTIFPVKSKTNIDIMSINLLLENETDPVIWRGPVIAGTVKQFWTDVLWENVDYLCGYASWNGRCSPDRIPVPAPGRHRRRNHPAGSGIPDREQGG